MAEIRFTLGEYLTPGSHKVAMSVPELVKETNDFSHKNTPGCVPKLLSSKPSDLFLEYNVKCDLKTSNPNGHTVRIKFDTSKVHDETSAKNLDVFLSCTCEAFLYYSAQWNLFQRDSLEGEPRPLLAPPTERLDLRNHFVLCKHTYLIAKRVLPSVQANINTILRKREVEKRTPNLPPTNEKLLKKQEESRKRQEIKKLREKRNKQIQKKLLEGLRKREEEQATTPGVIQRSEPATPGEKAKAPEITPDPALEKAVVPKPDSVPTPNPAIDKPKTVVKRDPVPATVSDSDRRNMEKLVDKEKGKTPKRDEAEKSPLLPKEETPDALAKLLKRERDRKVVDSSEDNDGDEA